MVQQTGLCRATACRGRECTRRSAATPAPWPHNIEVPDAVRFGRLDAARVLLDRGAGVDRRYKYVGRTALIEAVRRDDVAMARMLIDHGADVNARSQWQLHGPHPSVLDLAVNRGCSEEMLDMLRKAGARPAAP